MGKKGLKTKADYIPLEEFNRLITCLENDPDKRVQKFAKTWIFYLRISFYTAFRGSDTLSLTWKEILHTDKIIKVEQKTGKERTIALDRPKQKRIEAFYKLKGCPDLESYVFASSRKAKNPYVIDYVNRLFKRWKKKYKIKVNNFSTHSIRKLFGRHFWETNGRSEGALLFLTEIYRHADIKTTKIYLGIRDEEISEAYHAVPA